jgi:hypothetical protein
MQNAEGLIRRWAVLGFVTEGVAHKDEGGHYLASWLGLHRGEQPQAHPSRAAGSSGDLGLAIRG